MTSRPNEVLQTGISDAGIRFSFVPRRLLAVLLRSDRFQRDIIRLGGGTALGQLCVVAVAPALTRLYTPIDFALVGLVAAFVGFAAVAVGLRYDLAIVDARTDREAHILLFGAILSAIPVSLISSFIYLWMIYYRVLTFEKLPPWTAGLVFITLLLSGLFISCRLWCARVADFHIVSRALVLQGVGRAVFPLLLAPLHWGWVGLLSGEVVGRVLGVFGMVFRAINACRVQLATVTSAEIRKTLVAHRQYPLVMLPSSLLDALQGFLPLPIILTLFGPLNAGQFVLVARVSAMPMTLIAASVSDVYHSRIADIAHNSPQNTELVFREVALHLDAHCPRHLHPYFSCFPFSVRSNLRTQLAKSGYPLRNHGAGNGYSTRFQPAHSHTQCAGLPILEARVRYSSTMWTAWRPQWWGQPSWTNLHLFNRFLCGWNLVR